jgi:nitrate reductase gamma subunit
VIGQFILFIWRYQWNWCNFLPKGIILPLCQILAQRRFDDHLTVATTEVDHRDFFHLLLLFYQIIVGCLSSCKASVWNIKTLRVVSLNFAKSKLILWLNDLIVVDFSRIKVFF